MRYFFYIVLFSHITLLVACQKNNFLEKSITNNLLSVERIESSRMANFRIVVNESDLIFIKNETDTINVKKNTKEWKMITQLINDISLDKLESIKSPSQAFMYDGAANSSLVFETKDSTYYSKPYDKGNPAEELKKIDDYLTELSTSLSK